MDDQTPQTPPPAQTPPPSPQAPQPPKVPQEPQKQPGGYGKRPVWQWVVLYLIVGAIVYGLIYYFFMRGDGGGSYTY